MEGSIYLTLEAQLKKKETRAIFAYGKSKGLDVKLKGSHLVVDGVKYTTNENLPHDLSIENAKVINVKDGIAFRGPHAPYSNLHKVNFIHKGVPYNSSEQALHHTRATVGKQDNVADEIMKETNTYKIMNLGKKIQDTEEVKQNLPQYLADILIDKFGQNPDLKAKLLANDGHFFEATTNSTNESGFTLGQCDQICAENVNAGNQLGIEQEITSGVKLAKMAEPNEKVVIFMDSRGYNLQEMLNTMLHKMEIKAQVHVEAIGGATVESMLPTAEKMLKSGNYDQVYYALGVNNLMDKHSNGKITGTFTEPGNLTESMEKYLDEARKDLSVLTKKLILCHVLGVDIAKYNKSEDRNMYLEMQTTIDEGLVTLNSAINAINMSTGVVGPWLQDTVHSLTNGRRIHKYKGLPDGIHPD